MSIFCLLVCMYILSRCSTYICFIVFKPKKKKNAKQKKYQKYQKYEKKKKFNLKPYIFLKKSFTIKFVAHQYF